MKSAISSCWSALLEPKAHKPYGAISRLCLAMWLCCAFFHNISAQALNVDSLWRNWRNKSLPDTSRLNALLAISADDQNRNADTAMVHAKLGYQFALQRNLVDYQMKFLLQMAYARNQAGSFAAAEAFTKRSMVLAEKRQDDEHKFKCLMLLGSIYKTRSDYATSIDFYLRASKVATKLKDQKLILVTNLQLGNIYKALNEFPKYIHYSKEYLKFARMTKDTPTISNALSNLGTVYHSAQNLPEALNYYNQGLQMAKRAGITSSSGLSYMLIGDVYAQMNEPLLAISSYRSAMNEYSLKSDKLGQAQTFYRLAKLYKTQFPDSTLILARRALGMAKAIDRKILIANVAELLYQTYETRGQYQAALVMYKLHDQTRDSIYSQEQIQSIARSEAKYAYEKKELEDRVTFEQKLAQSRLSAQRQLFFLLGVIVLLVAGGALYMYNRKVEYQAERAEALLKISQLRESVAKQALSASGVGEKPILRKEKIEAAIASKLGETSWNILQLLAEAPTISNQQIAESLFLSEEGVSSSLRRMYSIFDIQSGNSKNHKIALLSKVVELSIPD